MVKRNFVVQSQSIESTLKWYDINILDDLEAALQTLDLFPKKHFTKYRIILRTITIEELPLLSTYIN